MSSTTRSLKVARHNDATLREHCDRWKQEQGTQVSVYAMCRALQRLKLTRKKSLAATEQAPEARAAWRQEVGALDPGTLVFVDEAGTHSSLTWSHARAPKGQRAFGKVPRNRGRNSTLLAALSPTSSRPSGSLRGQWMAMC